MTSTSSGEGAAEQRPILTEMFVWRGITVSASYEADWLGSGARGSPYAVAHLEIRSINPDKAPLPVTETGYRSHFLDCGVVEELGGPAAYAQAWLDEASRSPEWRKAEAGRKQLDLLS
jgi:hypothetical protein